MKTRNEWVTLWSLAIVLTQPQRLVPRLLPMYNQHRSNPQQQANPGRNGPNPPLHQQRPTARRKTPSPRPPVTQAK
jgi:hypothetical protein